MDYRVHRLPETILNVHDLMLYWLFYTFFRYSWVDDKTIVVSTIPASHGSPPKKPLSPACPNIQSNEQKLVVQNRTYQDLLKDKHDEDLFDFYTTTQLVLVTLDGTVRHIGSPAIYTSVDASPDCNFLLVDSLHRPYSFNVPWGRFPKKIEVWRRNGEFVKEICDLPLAENISIASNSTRKGRRGVNWRPDKPASLYWCGHTLIHRKVMFHDLNQEYFMSPFNCLVVLRIYVSCLKQVISALFDKYIGCNSFLIIVVIRLLFILDRKDFTND